MKKIVFIHLLNDRSGSPRILLDTIKAVQSTNIITEIITSNHQNGFLTNKAHIQRQLFYKRSENKIFTLLYYLFSQFLLFFQCFRYWNTDVIFFVNTMLPFGASLAALLMRKKVIYHIHETSIKPKILKKFLRLIISLTADRIIFVSEYLQTVESFNNKKQIVIYNSIQNTRSQIINKQKKNFEVLMVCSLKKYKGIFELFELAQLMKENNNIHFSLVLNATQDEISQYLDGIKLSPNITLYDRQPDVTTFYSQANILLNLTKPDEVQESFGLTILEGMAYGLPAIVPPVGGPTEIVRNDVEGYHVSCYDIHLIKEKIEFLMVNPSEYLRLSSNAFKRSNDFNINIYRKKILEVFKDISIEKN